VFKKDDTYEERVTLWRASDFDEAIALAEEEANEYAGTLGMVYLGLAQAFHPAESDMRSGAEIFSLVRQSGLEAEAYLTAFFDTGAEFQRDLSDRA
jgi:hypothetical protein